MPWGAAAAIGGALISSAATGDAADTQADATAASNAESALQYDNNVALNAPNINTGNAARDRLSYLLGISPTGFSGSTSVGGVGAASSAGGAPAAAGQSRDQIRNELLAQYTKQGATTSTPAAAPMWDPFSNAGQDNSFGQGVAGTTTTAPSTVDEAGLEAAIQARLGQQQQAQTAATQQATQAAQTDPKYGSLATGFTPETYTAATPYQAAAAYTPETFSYTGQDLYDDPSYQFRLSQGQKALDRQGAASGRFLSGAQLQASSNYNQGAASQEYQSAYSRALNTFGTNEGNRAQAYGTNENNRLNTYNVNETNRFNAFNTNETNRFNASQSNFSNAVNPLLSLAGSATIGAQTLGSAGMQTAQIIGNNTTAGANATGAAGIASANSISNGLANAASGYQQNQQATQRNALLQTMFPSGNSGVNNNPIGWNNGYGSTFLQNGNSSDVAYG